MDENQFKDVTKRWHQINNTSLPLQELPSAFSTNPKLHEQAKEPTKFVHIPFTASQVDESAHSSTSR